MTTDNPFNNFDPKAKWLCVYGASFAIQMRDLQRDGHALTDEAVKRCVMEAKAVADWEEEVIREYSKNAIIDW